MKQIHLILLIATKLLVVSLFLISCQDQKSAPEDVTPLNETKLNITNASEWLNINLDTSETNLFKAMKPIWSNIISNEHDGFIVHEVFLTNPEKILKSNESVNDFNYQILKNKNHIKLLLFEDINTNEISNGYYMSVFSEDSPLNINAIGYKNLSSFNGEVYFYDLGGNFTNGWSYLNGKVYEKMVSTKSTNSRTLAGCTPTYGWGCVGAHPDYMNCRWVEVGCEKQSKIEVGGEGSSGGGVVPPSGGNGAGSGSAAGKFILSASDQQKYPKFTSLVKSLYTYVQDDTKVMEALQKWTKLTSPEILSKIKFGSGPKIVIKSLTGSFGYFSKTENPNVINIDQEWVNGLEAANLKSTQQATAFLLGVTVLHEYVHQSRSENNLSNDYEYGEGFENSAYGLVIRASNASTYSYRMYKK